MSTLDRHIFLIKLQAIAHTFDPDKTTKQLSGVNTVMSVLTSYRI